jgi:hypothetical protein
MRFSGWRRNRCKQTKRVKKVERKFEENGENNNEIGTAYDLIDQKQFTEIKKDKTDCSMRKSFAQTVRLYTVWLCVL